MLIWVLYPPLLFTKIIVGIDRDNLVQFGIMAIASLVMLGLGLLLGWAVKSMTKPPIGFRYGCMLVLSLCDLPPFLPGDAARGVAYISAFLTLMNLFFFSIGYKLFGEDYRELKALKDRERVERGEEESVLDENADAAPLGAVDAEEKDQVRIEVDEAEKDGVDGGVSRPASVVSRRSGASSLARREKGKGNEKEAFGGGKGEEEGEERSKSATGLTAGDYVHEEATVGIQDGDASRQGPPSGWERVIGLLGFGPLAWWRRREGKPLFKEETWFWIKSLTNLANLATVFGLIIAVTPALKHLFRPTLPLPSPEPPLLFLFEIFEFIGNSAVPLGLLNLGAALGRLNLGKMMDVKIPIAVAVARLIVVPCIGFLVIWLITRGGTWGGEGDRILRFVLMMEACVPTASSTVFLTQMWHPKGEADYIASVVLVQYAAAAFTMIICLSVALGFVSA
ncbi:Protein M3 [Phlyctochytrium planicorne]|nr:Protein M3 [Phlyctochytrium planicorne]